MSLKSVLNNLAVIIFTILAFSNNTLAQEGGKIAGSVVDGTTGEALIGVNVIVEGTRYGAATDIDGKFQIRSLTPGTYTLKFSYISYTSVTVKQIQVAEGRQANIDVQLKPEARVLQEIVVSADMLKDNENYIIKVQKNSSGILDAVSAELIKKNGSSDGADVLKRMTGVAISEGKYAYIRGVSDRYNSTLLNGASLPGTDPEKKSFSYDIFPSSLIENVLTAKTFTPDKPADFTGGLVQINTVEFPTRFFADLSASSSYNTATSLKSFVNYSGGSTDFLGIDDGTRKKPDIIDHTKVVRGNYSSEQLRQIGLSFGNDWNTIMQKAPVNFSYKLSAGSKIDFDETSSLGVIGSLTYSNGRESREFDRASATYDGPRYQYSGTNYSENILWGAMFNASYKSGNNKISSKNLYNQNSDNDILINEGIYNYTSQIRKTTALRFVSRSLLSTQLAGEHILPELNGSGISWTASYSNSKRDEPDARQYVYSRSMEDQEEQFRLLLDPSLVNRFYGSLNDKLSGIKVDITIKPFEVPEKPVVKLGVLYDKKSREFDARIFGFINMPGGSFAEEDSIAKLPIDEIFRPENFNSGFIQVMEITKGSDSYTSDQRVLGTYLMLDAVVLDKIKITGGLRYEKSEQNLYSRTETNIPVELKPSYGDILPAINLTYLFSEKINIRGAYSKTLARPEFRELAPYTYYDFLTSELVKGETTLRRTLINNYDFRIEMYPESGEIFAASIFYKKMTNPIEQVFLAASGFEAYRSYRNAEEAENYGAEFEVRKNLGFLGEVLRPVSFIGNLSLIKSKVKIPDSLALGFARAERPMQGQSDYIFNLGLYYENPVTGLSANVVYNKIGDKISEAGFINVGDIVERQRDVIDISISKKFFERLSVGFSARDILSQDAVFIQKRPGGDFTEARYRKGKNFSVGISYSL